MLIVPTTPISIESSLPIPGGWTEVCLHLNGLPQPPFSESRSAALSGTYRTNRSHPGHRQVSINP